MLWWLVDNANTLIVLLGLVVIALSAAWWNTRNRNVALAALTALGLAVLVWLLSVAVVTDRKKLVANVQSMVSAVNADRIDAAMLFFADEVKLIAPGQSFNGPRKALGDLARSNLQNSGLRPFVVWNVDVVSVERPRARLTFYVRPDDDPKFVQCQADFVLAGEMDWRIQELRIEFPGQRQGP